MVDPLVFCAVPLDRSGRERIDPAWFAGRLAMAAVCVVPVWRERSVFVAGARARAAFGEGPMARSLLAAAGIVALLGTAGNAATWIAADVSELSEADLTALLGPIETDDLRQRAALLPTFDAGVLAYARGLIYWHRRHRFCGVCGGETESRHAGHLRTCLAAGCSVEHYPRTDPAVIMLVTRSGGTGDPADDLCLLGRQPRWPAGLISTLAGFVEPGESLEDAVRREVREEVGIDVDAVTYRGSQPWPFPSSIMLGFRAEADSSGSDALDIDPAEIEEARWFRREEVGRLRSLGYRMPNRFSIARRLVEDWLAEAAG